jgi:hypothetical protein
MDMSDLTTARPASASRQPRHAAEAELDTLGLLTQMAAEVAAALSPALERVNTLATTGSIDRSSLQALRDEVELARRIGIMGQQISRLASGRIRLGRERLNLTDMLRDALVQRGREIEARGIEVRQTLRATEVHSDAPLLFALLQTLLDWGFEHAAGRIDLSIDIKSWPANALLRCAFLHRAPDEVDSATMPLDGAGAPEIDTISWRLLQQTVATLGLRLERRDTVVRTQLCIEFPDTVSERLGQDAGHGAGPELAKGENSRPLAGSHVLVVAPRREIRNLVREATRSMGLLIDYVTSVTAAREFCSGGLPHAVLHEAALGGEHFEDWRQEVLARVPALSFIQITEEGKAFEVVNVGGRQFASLGRDGIIESLATALVFELSRCR